MTALVQHVKPLHVEVISNHELIRAGLTLLLQQDPDRDVVVGLSSDWHVLGPRDVALYDLMSFAGNAQEQLRQLAVGGAVVVPLVAAGDETLAQAARSLGFVDVVTMDLTASDLLDALERAVRRVHKANRPGSDLDRLTPREMQIITLIAAGRSNHEIAEELYLSVNSIKTYIRTAYRKMGVTSRSQAVLWAVGRHLI